MCVVILRATYPVHVRSKTQFQNNLQNQNGVVILSARLLKIQYTLSLMTEILWLHKAFHCIYYIYAVAYFVSFLRVSL